LDYDIPENVFVEHEGAKIEYDAVLSSVLVMEGKIEDTETNFKTDIEESIIATEKKIMNQDATDFDNNAEPSIDSIKVTTSQKGNLSTLEKYSIESTQLENFNYVDRNKLPELLLEEKTDRTREHNYSVLKHPERDRKIIALEIDDEAYGFFEFILESNCLQIVSEMTGTHCEVRESKVCDINF
jgi:hypothetical protein